MNFDKLKLHKTFPFNRSGIDYFVGDIHGHHTLLLQQLDAINFNFRRDRLFAVGDIIDRGPESERCLDLLVQPWFKSVIGNHEHLFLQGIEGPKNWEYLLNNGGHWIPKWLGFSGKLVAWANLIRIMMPISITVETRFGSIGVLHADAPTDWKMLINDRSVNIIQCIWNRQDFSVLDKAPITSVDAVFHGHNQVDDAIIINNQIWADTLQKTGKLSIMSAEEVMRCIHKK